MFFWALYVTLFFRQLASVISDKPTTSFPTTSTNLWQQAVLVMNNPTETAFSLRCLSVLFESTLKANEIKLFPTDFLSSREKCLNLILNWRTILVRVALHASHNEQLQVEQGKQHDHSLLFSRLEVGGTCPFSSQTSLLGLGNRMG